MTKVILGDFNLEATNPSIVSFMNNQNLFNFVKKVILVLKEKVRALI